MLLNLRRTEGEQAEGLGLIPVVQTAMTAPARPLITEAVAPRETP